MNREISRFLLESWQLFYWSLFFPSKLKLWIQTCLRPDEFLRQADNWLQIIDDTHPQTHDLQTKSESIYVREKFSQLLADRIFDDGNIFLIFQASNRFIIQYSFVSLIVSLPVICLAIASGEDCYSLLCSFFFLSACIISGTFFLPSGLGFCIPFLLSFVYLQKSNFISMLPGKPRLFQALIQSQLMIGIEIGFIALLFTTVLTVILLKNRSFVFAHHILWIGPTLASLIFMWVASHSITNTLISSFFTGILMFWGCKKIKSKRGILIAITNVIAMITSAIVSGILTTSIFVKATGDFEATIPNLIIVTAAMCLSAFVTSDIVIALVLCGSEDSIVLAIIGFCAGCLVGSAVAIITSVLSTLSLLLFLLGNMLIAASCAALNQRFFGVCIATIFLEIGLSKFGLNGLWIVPLSLICYYRILPDYFLACQYSLFYGQSRLNWFAQKPASFLTKLPPYTTEFLWISLPNHAQILADTFHQDPSLGFSAFQKMQAISLPGFRLTLQKALPSIVADLFAVVNTTPALIESVTPTHPLLPLLIPAFYQFDENAESVPNPKSGEVEIDVLFPLLQKIAKGTAAALEGGSSALRERGLERLVDKLKMLLAQLPGLGLKPQAVKRWKPTIERWQHILELEIAEQKKTSQGELINPFQWGNPLPPDRAAIFKGRQDFADRLVRLILDRNRPTLVLHGPRRAGKTSFLLNLPRLLPSDLVPIYLDMQQGSMTSSEGDFCYGLVRAIDRDTRSQGLQLPPIPSRQAFATQPYPTLEDWLDLALPKLGERRLLLNLDEFEKIGSAIKDGRISDRLFDQLRSMIQHYDRLGFLFSGVQTLEELGPRWSNYFISVVPMEMHYLEPHEAEDLLLHPDPEFTLQYDAGIVAEILRLTRCQPYLLQLIGSAIVNQANLQHTQLATTALLQAAIQSAFTNGEPYFTNIWTEFTGTTLAEVTAGQQILIALAQGNYHVESIDEAITTAARRRLLRYHVIERDGDIDMIGIPLLEQWVRERAIHQR